MKKKDKNFINSNNKTYIFSTMYAVINKSVRIFQTLFSSLLIFQTVFMFIYKYILSKIFLNFFILIFN